MQYTGTKYTQVEAAEIMATARATVRQVKADQLQWAEDRARREMGDLRRNSGADRFVTKTVEHARVPAPPAQEVSAPDDYSGATIIEAMGQVIASERRVLQAALAKRDRDGRQRGRPRE